MMISVSELSGAPSVSTVATLSDRLLISSLSPRHKMKYIDPVPLQFSLEKKKTNLEAEEEQEGKKIQNKIKSTRSREIKYLQSCNAALIRSGVFPCRFMNADLFWRSRYELICYRFADGPILRLTRSIWP